jgi:trigger factor
MKATLETLGAWERRLSVEVPPEEVGDSVERAYRELSRRARVKGFRPGKIPRSVLERLYGDRVRNEVIQNLVQRTFADAVREHQLEPVSEPVVEPEKLESGRPWRYTARLEVKPEVRVTAWRGLPLIKAPVAVDDAQVQERIERLAEMQSQLVAEDETPLARGHFAVIDFEGRIDGTPFPGGKGSDVTLEVGSGSFVPGFEEQLEGMARGESREIAATFPADYRNAALAGKEARFDVRLKEIKRKVVPAIDDELAKDLGDFETLDALRVKVREDLLVEAEREARRELREQARRALVEANPVEAPPALVEREFRTMVEGTRRRLAAQGVSMDQLGLSAEVLEKEWRPRAEESVKASLLLEQIAREEKIAVPPEAIDEELQRLARENRQTARAVRQAYEERGLIPVLESRLKEEKALDLMLETATMQEGNRAENAAVKSKKGRRS